MSLCRMITLVALLGLLGAPTYAAQSETVAAGDAEFAKRLQIDGRTLLLRGASVLRWKLFFTPYAMSLYLPPSTPVTRWRDDVPKCLVIEYFRGIDGDQFAPAAEQVLERTFKPAMLERVAGPLQALNEAYVGVEAGDRYALCYAPGRGTTLALNGERLATVGGGARFAAIYFAIWLGPEPVSDSLRDAIVKAG